MKGVKEIKDETKQAAETFGIPLEAALRKSIKNNLYFYYVALFAWVGFLLYAQAYRDGWLLFDSIMFLMCAIYFSLARKIDNMRLEMITR